MAEAEKKPDQTFTQVKIVTLPPNEFSNLSSSTPTPFATHHYTHPHSSLSDFDYLLFSLIIERSDDDGALTGERRGERSRPWPLRRARVSSSSHRHFSCKLCSRFLIWDSIIMF